MSVETKYICDRCKAVQYTNEQMWSVAFVYKHGIDKQNKYQLYDSDRKADWCRKCLETFGLLPPIELQDRMEEIKKNPTLEDMIRGIVQQELEPGNK